MMRFTFGLAILVFTVIIGLYQYFENTSLIEAKERGLRDVKQRLDDALTLQERVKNVRNISMLEGDDQKFPLERALNIGEPGMQLRFVGQARYAGSNRGLFRHTFRITGPATFEDTVQVLQTMSGIKGFAPYKYCIGCANTPKGTPDGFRMVQIEGYLYVYDANIL